MKDKDVVNFTTRINVDIIQKADARAEKLGLSRNSYISLVLSKAEEQQSQIDKIIGSPELIKGLLEQVSKGTTKDR